ncbi:DUF3427 domain-containing protein [Sphingomonas trueperi]|uniref:DUF3427 domain-containing protein n=1 Tax=Sphingomonas trueperi TaxID=53317 RepID=UPI000EB31FC1
MSEEDRMKPAKPILYQRYSRLQARNLLAPNEPFTSGAGQWGLQGILPIPGAPGSFAFFVSLGQSTGSHTFDEGISTEGILRWQSQPKQHLLDKTILSLISHDEAVSDIHFFLRTSSRRNGVSEDYTYLGPLRYISHDAEREYPVYFAWEVINWPIPDNVLTKMRLVLDKEEGRLDVAEVTRPAPGLTAIAAPVGRSWGETTRTFQARKFRRKTEQESRALGLAGELLVVDHERRILAQAGRPDLAAKVDHISVNAGDGAGYDIRSFNLDGSDRFIEVKTTTGVAGTPFYISANEVDFSELVKESFFIYRVCEFDQKSNSGKFYLINGIISDSHCLKPVLYRAVAKPDC